MLVKVPTVRTPYTSYELTKAFIQGWFAIYNAYPKKECIGVVWAQNALETGGGGTSCWNFNLANVKAKDVQGETINYAALVGVWEMVNGKKIILSSEDPGSWFRAFDTLADGVEFYFNFLRNKRYKIAWTSVEKGDPKNFAALLKAQGFYTASLESYTTGLVARFNVFMRSNDFEKAMEEIHKPAAVEVAVDDVVKEKNAHNSNTEQEQPISEAAPRASLPNTNAKSFNIFEAIMKVLKIMFHIK